MRREAVAAALNRLIDGDPGLLLSPACTSLRKGFVGGYHYRRVRAGANPDTYYESPVKNTYSHPHDALQYLLLGGGEHSEGTSARFLHNFRRSATGTYSPRLHIKHTSSDVDALVLHAARRSAGKVRQSPRRIRNR